MMETRTICASNFFKFNDADGREEETVETALLKSCARRNIISDARAVPLKFVSVLSRFKNRKQWTL